MEGTPDMLHRALTDFVVGAEDETTDVPVLIHGGDVVDDKDKKYAPIVKRFAHNFVPAE
jgi:hypothetical protein